MNHPKSTRDAKASTRVCSIILSTSRSTLSHMRTSALMLSYQGYTAEPGCHKRYPCEKSILVSKQLGRPDDRRFWEYFPHRQLSLSLRPSFKAKTPARESTIRRTCLPFEMKILKRQRWNRYSMRDADGSNPPPLPKTPSVATPLSRFQAQHSFTSSLFLI